MSFDKWFKSQRRLIQLLLLVIPFVGWVVEILVRVSATLRKASTTNLLGLIIFFVAGLFLSYVDLVWVILTNNLILVE